MGVPKYRRILLKISGEALAGENGSGLDDTGLTFAEFLETDAGKEQTGTLMSLKLYPEG